jgi:hypothetical protein
MRSVSRTADRRRTIAATEITANANNEESTLPLERMRRMSIGSTVSTGSTAPAVQVKKTRAPTTRPSAAAARPSTTSGPSSVASTRPAPAHRVSSGRVTQPKVSTIGEEPEPPKAGPTRLKLIVKNTEEKTAEKAAPKPVARKAPAARAPKATTSSGARKPAAKSKMASPPAVAGAPDIPPAPTSNVPTLNEHAVSNTNPNVPAIKPEINGTSFVPPVVEPKMAQSEKPSPATPNANAGFNNFESDPLSNPTLAWGAPQNDVKWVTPMTISSSTESQAVPQAPRPPQIPKQEQQENKQQPLSQQIQLQGLPSEQPVIKKETPPQPEVLVTPRKAPVFASSGFIPFAPTTPIAGGHASKDLEEARANGGSISESASGDDGFTSSGTTQGDIWDIPVTPPGN